MIEVSHLCKFYGTYPAVKDLSFQLPDGHVYGFLGPNGAGKSTTMNMLTGCLSPTGGTVRIDGFDILEQPENAKRRIGYLPEQPPLYPNETPREYLRFVGEAKGLRGKALREEVARVAESTGITQVEHQLIGTLSKGYRQRVGIAQALLGSPRVIILDEPTVGLDPLQIMEIRAFIRKLGESHTVIFSSHILSEVQAVCDRVLILSKGELVAYDAPENLEKHLLEAQGAVLRVESPGDRAEEILKGIPGLSHWELAEQEGICTITVSFSPGEGTRELCGSITLTFAAQGIPVLEMQQKRLGLEDVFLELTEEKSGEEPVSEKEDGK